MFAASLKNFSRSQPFHCCTRLSLRVNSQIQSRLFIRSASVKSDVPPTKTPRKSRKAVESSSPEIPTAKANSVPKKARATPFGRATPPSVKQDAPPLITKGASAVAKDAQSLSKKTPATKSPPQTSHPAATPKASPAKPNPPVVAKAIPKIIPSAMMKPARPPALKAAVAVVTEVDMSAGAIPASPPPPAVGIWLMVSSVLVLVVVVVGGITRLTESGLSITEWRPITGILPPMSQESWEEEFSKYKTTPEFKMLNSSSSLDDFKRIYYMEWSHRILGRLVGLVFVVPLAYFTVRKKISTPLALKLSGLGLLIGAQGALGWYMVQSGMEDSLLDTPGAVPRVSHYRLAAHLAMAFALYTGMFSTGMAILKDWRFVQSGMSSGLPGTAFTAAMKHPIAKRFRAFSWGLTALVFATALSGVFVAGLDAGLVYNEWPFMGDGLIPPTDELFSPAYSKSEDNSDLWWRNIFENPTTVQFDHRMLATATYTGMALLFVQTFRPAVRSIVPPLALLSARAAFVMANVQALLGISTLIYLVPVPLAAAHQGGSILLLSAMLQLLIALRRPGVSARAWRNVMSMNKAMKKGAA